MNQIIINLYEHWTYANIHPVKYRPVAGKVRKALNDLKAEYGVAE
jgi:hypothetical protein